MTVTVKTLLEAKFAENAQTIQYTCPAGVRVTITKATASNATGVGATIAANVVPIGGTAGGSNLTMPAVTVAGGGAYTCPELVGQVLSPGDFISTLAGTVSAITFRLSGVESTI